MIDYPNIRMAIRTFYNVEDGLSAGVAKGLYIRSLSTSPNREALKSELIRAFADDRVSWRSLLSNGEYESFDADSEEDARACAQEFLWDPIFND